MYIAGNGKTIAPIIPLTILMMEGGRVITWNGSSKSTHNKLTIEFGKTIQKIKIFNE